MYGSSCYTSLHYQSYSESTQAPVTHPCPISHIAKAHKYLLHILALPVIKWKYTSNYYTSSHYQSSFALHHGVRIHAYADDLQTYGSCKAVNQNAVICQIQACITDIDGWLSSNRLKFNADKTEFIWHVNSCVNSLSNLWILMMWA